MWSLVKSILTDPTWSAIAIGFLSSAAGWVWRQLSADQRATILDWERYARDAGAWAILHAPPGVDANTIAGIGSRELDQIIARVGIKVPDDVRAHLDQTMRGFIVSQLNARKP